VFTATAAGAYTIQAAIGSTDLTTTVNVYGQATGVTLSAASSSVIANGTSTDAITAKVVDTNGNVVSNFNGTLLVPGTTSVTDTNNGATALKLTNGGYIEGGTYVSASTSMLFTVTNGVANITFVSGLGSAATSSTAYDTVTVNSLQSTNGQSVATSVNYGSVTVNYAAQTASALKLTPTLTTMSSNSSTEDDVTVNVVDASGAAVSSGNPAYVTFTLTGPATFQQGAATPLTTYTAYVPANSAGLTLPVYSIVGQNGTVTLTATASGLTSASTTITAAQTMAASSITATSSNGTLTATTDGLPAGTAYTKYTVQVTDANGNPVVPSSDQLTISDNTSALNDGGHLDYYTVNSTTGQPQTKITSGTVSVSSSTGSASFIVLNTTVGTTSPTISIYDAATGVTKTQTYNYVYSSAASLSWATGSSTVVPGGSSTYTVQLLDNSGNKLNVSGQSVSFYFGSNPQSATINASSSWSSANPVVVTTNANGQASVTVNVPSTASTTSSNNFVIDAVETNNSLVTLTPLTVGIIPAVNQISQIGVATTTSGSVAFSWPTSLTAGNTLQTTTNPNIYAVTENQVGQQVIYGSDAVKVITSNPNVIALPSYDSGSTTTKTITTSSGYVTLPTITAMNAGTATLTLADVATGVTFSKTLTVTAASVPSQIVVVNPDSTVNKGYAISATGVAGPFTIETADSGLNMVPFNNSVTLSSADVLKIVGLPGALGVRTSATGSDVSSVTIGASQGTTQVWIDGASAGNTIPTAESINFSLSSIAPLSAALAVNVNSTTPSAIGIGTSLTGLAANANVFAVGAANVTSTTQSGIQLVTNIQYGGSGTFGSIGVYYWNGSSWTNSGVTTSGTTITIPFTSASVNSGVTNVYNIAITGNVKGTYNVDSVVKSGSNNISGQLLQSITLN
jgi:hypothetical protein